MSKSTLDHVAFALVCLGLFLRLAFLPVITIDMHAYLLWYNYIAQYGILQTLGDQSFGYNPPFIYLLSLATLTRAVIPPVWAIKLIAISFDVVNAYLVYKIVQSISTDRRKPRLAALGFWVAPTVLINSSIWGQTDALYVCFLLLCLLFVFKSRPTWAVIAFSLSIAIKAQGIFLAPFLAVLLLKKNIPWHTYLLVPFVYVAAFLPALLSGRPIGTLLSTYAAQGETFSRPSMNAPNLYFFLPASAYQTSLLVGIPLACLALVTWVLISGSKRHPPTKPFLMITALVSVSLTPFLLPKMHDRYFYPADVFSILAGFSIPGLTLVPIIYQAISLLSYLPYLVGADSAAVIPTAVFLNVVVLGSLLWKQWSLVPPIEVQSDEGKEAVS